MKLDYAALKAATRDLRSLLDRGFAAAPLLPLPGLPPPAQTYLQAWRYRFGLRPGDRLLIGRDRLFIAR